MYFKEWLYVKERPSFLPWWKLVFLKDKTLEQHGLIAKIVELSTNKFYSHMTFDEIYDNIQMTSLTIFGRYL